MNEIYTVVNGRTLRIEARDAPGDGVSVVQTRDIPTLLDQADRARRADALATGLDAVNAQLLRRTEVCWKPIAWTCLPRPSDCAGS